MNPEDDTVDELRKVNEMLQAEVSEVSSTLVMLVEAFNKIMANQNNMNLRLVALEKRQDPAKHNSVIDYSLLKVSPCKSCVVQGCRVSVQQDPAGITDCDMWQGPELVLRDNRTAEWDAVGCGDKSGEEETHS